MSVICIMRLVLDTAANLIHNPIKLIMDWHHGFSDR